MFCKLKRGKQNELIKRAIVKAGSERKLCKLIGISKGAIYGCKHELWNIPKERLDKILKFIGLDTSECGKYILEELPKDWGRRKGGINCVAKKKKDGTFEETIRRLRKGSSRYMKKWHKNMRENSPKVYHIWQYEKFKKVGRGFCFSLKNNTLVRNRLKKKIGDFLIINKFRFEYEPYIHLGGKAYFPDFKVDNKIIEVTEWKHPNKNRILKVKKKIRDFKAKGFKIIFFIPQNFRKFYKEIDDSIISTLPEIKTFLMP
jgi:hypothetical protein